MIRVNHVFIRKPCTISGWIRHRLRGLRRRNQSVLPILQAQAQLASGVCGDDGSHDPLVDEQLASHDAGNSKRGKGDPSYH